MNDRITARKIGYAVSIGTVALIAAWVSYRHLREVATVGGQPIEVAAVLPLSVDGMLLAATLAMADDKAEGRRPRGWARLAFWLGATISVAANVASTVVDNGINPLSIGVAAWAPVALLVVTEIMARKGKPIEDEREAQLNPAAGARQKTAEERLEDRRRRAGYYQMDSAQRAAWTREDNKRQARRKERMSATAPVSPGFGPVDAPSKDEVAEMVG